MLDLVWNSEEGSLADFLRTHIVQANRIDMAVAFLNDRGLSLVEDELQAALDRGCAVRLFVGTDFYLTDPKTLRRLQRSFKQQGRSELFLVGQNPKAIFHPKVYVVEKSEEIIAIVGSANLTGGGLSDNQEACCVFSAPLGSEIQDRFQLLFAQYESAEDVREATIWEIERYAAEHRAFRKQVKTAERQAYEEIGSIPKLDEDKLRAHLAEYRANEQQQADYQVRLINYQEARELLDQLASSSVTNEAQFRAIWERLIGSASVDRVWHSDYMYRRGHEAVQNFAEVCRMVKAIRDNENLSPRKLFELGQQHASRIRGLGVNALTEMMNTYYPDECAVLNKNPWTSLRYFGLSAFPEPGFFRGHHYERFNNVIAYIKDLCGFESMGQADHFLNFVYWGYAKEREE